MQCNCSYEQVDIFPFFLLRSHFIKKQKRIWQRCWTAYSEFTVNKNYTFFIRAVSISGHKWFCLEIMYGRTVKVYIYECPQLGLVMEIGVKKWMSNKKPTEGTYCTIKLSTKCVQSCCGYFISTCENTKRPCERAFYPQQCGKCL